MTEEMDNLLEERWNDGFESGWEAGEKAGKEDVHDQIDLWMDYLPNEEDFDNYEDFVDAIDDWVDDRPKNG